MVRFLKKLYEQRHKEITVIALDDSKPGEDNSYTVRPNHMFLMMGVICGIAAILLVVLFMITPLGSLLYTKEDAAVRLQVEQITERVLSLQDSLIIRDQQLTEMKDVIRLSIDTTLTIDQRFISLFDLGAEQVPAQSFEVDAPVTSRVSPSGIVFSNILESAPDFPSSYPVKGTQTRGYEPDVFHFGIDIATSEDEIVTSIADGTVVNASWTISDGYVVSIQHAGGILSIYKHCTSLTKKSGDIVLKGDIIGTAGDIGVLSTGPHLHLEIWKDGLPQNPEMYLIQ